MKGSSIIAKGKNYILATKNGRRLAAAGGVLLIALAGQIVYSSFAATTSYSPILVVAEMQRLTEEVVTRADEYANLPDTTTTKKGVSEPNSYKKLKKDELALKIKVRKDLYKQAARYDPQVTANYYLPEATRSKLPKEFASDLEQQVETGGVWVNGVVDVNHAVGPADRASINANYVYLQDVTGANVYLYATKLPSVKTGSVVRVKGIRVDDVMAVARPLGVPTPSQGNTVLIPKAEAVYIPVIDDLSEAIHDAGADIFDNLVFCSDRATCQNNSSGVPLVGEEGERKTLVIPVNFKDDTESPLTIDNISNAYYAAANIFETMSYGKFKPEYEVLQQWMTIDGSNVYDCTPEKLGDVQIKLNKQTKDTLKTAQDGAIKAKILDGGYTDLMYVYNRTACTDPKAHLSASGWADLGGNRGEYLGESVVLLNNISPGEGYDYFIGTMVHELGHGFGLDHASGGCNLGANSSNPAQLDQAKYCTAETAEYADPYNFMGGHEQVIGYDAGVNQSYNFANKLKLSWVTEEDLIQVPEEGGEYTINALSKSSGKRALRLDYGEWQLFIEYRPQANNAYSTGLINYVAGDAKTRTYLFGSRYQFIAGESGAGSAMHLWDYMQAAKREPYRIGEGESSICVTPTNATADTVRVKVEKNCTDQSQPAGAYQSVGKWSVLTPDSVGQSRVLAKDSKGNFYAKDTNDWVRTYDPSGVFGTKWISTDTSQDMAIDSKDNIYISGSGDVVRRFDTTGKLLSTLTGVAQPRGIAFDSSDNVYVASRGSHQIRKFDNTGKLLSTWGSNGTGDGQMRNPGGIAVDSKGNVYVRDTGNNRIQKFDSTGKFLAKWGSSGSGDGQFGSASNSAAGIVADAQDNIYVADAVNYRIQKFDSNGNFMTKWGTFGSADGQFYTPEDLVVDSRGDVYVIESNNGRVQKFSQPIGPPIERHRLKF